MLSVQVMIFALILQSQYSHNQIQSSEQCWDYDNRSERFIFPLPILPFTVGERRIKQRRTEQDNEVVINLKIKQ